MQRPRKSGAFVFLGVWSKNSNALIHNTEIVRRGPVWSKNSSVLKTHTQLLTL